MTLDPKQFKRLTMAQIAEETGVSITTVSKVLNNMPGVGNQTRERIRRSSSATITSRTMPRAICAKVERLD